MKSLQKKQYAVGLALSGGGAKGFAHAGAIKALEEFHIYPDLISGTSAGAIVGSLYADGCNPHEIIELFNHTSFYKFASFARSKSGLFKIDNFRKAMEQKLKAKTFEELNIPLYVNATDMFHGKNVFFSSGSLLDKVIASCSIPIIFEPVLIDGIHYSDGGLLCNFPVEVLRKQCQYLIGVNVSPVDIDHEEQLNLLDIIQRTYFFIRKSNVINSREQCDLLIEPPSIDKYGMFDAVKNEEIFQLGYQAALAILNAQPEIVKEMQALGSPRRLKHEIN
ncbi:MAG: patatin-like phospholipase family protein [Bacteroidales bacterium]|jgi:NTE family protein|nr:patatin-like phospholipase family protein [Bacteroidales bacterium]NLB02271.1 patatin-like phospholipase family protein [Bacteroidales bacterium]